MNINEYVAQYQCHETVFHANSNQLLANFVIHVETLLNIAYRKKSQSYYKVTSTIDRYN